LLCKTIDIPIFRIESNQITDPIESN